MKRVLVVAAHPDDEVLGCGGTLALLSQNGFEVHVLVLGEGVTSRDPVRNSETKAGKIEALRNAGRRASELLGISHISFESLPDNRFDTVPLLEIVKQIEETITQLSPMIILTHFTGDLNVDHRITAQAVLTAARPLPGSPIQAILGFEIPSSTEWGFSEFFPTVYVPIFEYLDLKLSALSAYAEELRNFPHPRSPEAILALARKRGSEVGVPAAEAFVLYRAIGFFKNFLIR